jgi:hypothetical protein
MEWTIKRPKSSHCSIANRDELKVNKNHINQGKPSIRTILRAMDHYFQSRGQKQTILLLIATIIVAINIARSGIQLGNLFSQCNEQKLETDAHRLRGNISGVAVELPQGSESSVPSSTEVGANKITLESNLLNLWNHIPEPNEQRPVQQLVLANFIPSPKTYPQDDVVMITHTHPPTDTTTYSHRSSGGTDQQMLPCTFKIKMISTDSPSSFARVRQT